MGYQGYIEIMKIVRKYFVAHAAVAGLCVSLLSGYHAIAVDDPFPNLAFGGEIGSRQAVSSSTGNPLDGSPIITCPAGAGLAAVSDSLIGNYVVCTKTWRPLEEIDADANFRVAQEAANAIATKQSQDWNAANPGQQKCFQWGPIVHANGVSTASGGVCANVVPVSSNSSGANSETPTVSSLSPTPTASSLTSDSQTVNSVTVNSNVETQTASSVPVSSPSASSTPVNGLAGVGGWAVIDSTGKVYGVIVCDNSVCGANGSWGGVMPVEYMGCPAGCRLVLQTSADPQTGNVAGWRSQAGTDVFYNEQTNTFSVQQRNESTPTLIITPPTSTAFSFSTLVNQSARILDTSTATSETPTATSDTGTVLTSPGLPIVPISSSLALEPVLADVIPLESDGEEIEEPPAAEIGVRKEASGKFLISLDSNIYEDQLMVRAFKKGSKVIVFKVSTNIDGQAAIRTARNLTGYKLAVYAGDQFLDSVRL